MAKSWAPQNMYGGMKVHGGFYQVYKVQIEHSECCCCFVDLYALTTFISLQSINRGCLKQHGLDLVERIVERVGVSPSCPLVLVLA